MKKLSDVVRKRNEHLAEQYTTKMAGGEVVEETIPTGLLPLDKLGLLQKKILTIIGGDPGAGKTSWAIQFLMAAAKAGYKPAAFFFEDPLEFLSDRITGQGLGVSAYKLRKLEVDDDDICDRLAAVSDTMDWLSAVSIEDRITPSTDLLELLDRTVTESTGLVIVDYAQAFDSEQDEKSVERVINRLAWGLGQIAKKKNVAIVLFSQLKTEVKDRGNRWFENYRYKVGEPGPDTPEAVEGFRPRPNDLQWSSGLYQKAKMVGYIFRPNAWLRSFGVAAQDNIVDFQIDKGNFGPNKEIVRLGWNGETAKIYELKKKKA